MERFTGDFSGCCSTIHPVWTNWINEGLFMPCTKSTTACLHSEIDTDRLPQFRRVILVLIVARVILVACLFCLLSSAPCIMYVSLSVCNLDYRSVCAGAPWILGAFV